MQNLKVKFMQSFIARSFKYLRFIILRLLSNPHPHINIKLKHIENIAMLSNGSNATFFGYHDKTPFSADGLKILAMAAAVNDAQVKSECKTIELGYFAKNDSGEFINDFIPFAETNTWCWQQGCMLQWHPKNPECEVVFNKLVEGNYGSVVFNVNKGEMVRQYKAPIYSLDPKGHFATTLDFYRLGYLRPGYGYLSLPNENIRWNSPENDGLYILNLHTGEKNLLVSFNSLAADLMISGYKHYVNHANFSPAGDRLIFFHLWTNMQERGLRVLIINPLTGRYNVLEDERIVSHYCWKDNNTILATSRDERGSWHYSFYDLKTGKRNDLDLPLNIDGHPMFHPHNKDIFVTDTYPDARREQHLYLVNISDNKVTEIGSFFSPYKYRGQVRCDLHPRWDRDGKYIAVDSPNGGMREISILKVDII